MPDERGTQPNNEEVTMEPVAKDLYEALSVLADECLDRPLSSVDVWPKVEAALDRAEKAGISVA